MRRISGRFGILASIGLLLATVFALPAGASIASAMTVKTTHAVSDLAGVKSLASDGNGGYCGVLTSGKVDCWGKGNLGQLGNGKFYSTGNQGSDVPVSVKGVGGTGVLSDVASLSDNGGVEGGGGYCALLISAKVDCWGGGVSLPTAVKGVGGTGTLGGVARLIGFGDGYCALLSSAKVDCWGDGQDGELGNGSFNYSASVPVTVVGVSGTGTLTSVVSAVSNDQMSGGDEPSICAGLSTGKVDCWGYGTYGELGNGRFYTASPYGSAVPVAVDGLSGVASLIGEPDGNYCALLASGKVDCWGYGDSGQLGNGVFYTSGNQASALPVAVKGVGGRGTLTDVSSLGGEGQGGGYCALLTSHQVDCWGSGINGALGNGKYYASGPHGSAVPVDVVALTGTGTLGNVKDIADANDNSYCARLSSAKVNCWGYGQFGEMGNGRFYENDDQGSGIPVSVKGIDGTGTLTSVSSLTSDGTASYCAIVSGRVACWGYGESGQIGDGSFYSAYPNGIDVPKAVLS